MRQARATQFAPRRLLHFGQGKWYPGEQLPRWALDCYWRNDGEPIWRDPALLADESDKPTAPRREMRAALLRRLRASGCGSIPSYVFAGLRGRLLLPVARAAPAGQRRSVRRREADGPDGARAAARACSSRASTTPVGYVLPIAARSATAAAAGAAGRGSCADERCYLIPGDSPIGYRLPLDSLPWVDAGGLPDSSPSPIRWRRIRRCRRSTPSAARRCCAARNAACRPTANGDGDARREAWRRALAPDLGPRPGVGHSAGDIVRTALCVEPRDGHLYVFMPPLERARGLPRPASPPSRPPPQELRPAGRARRLRAAAAIRACNMLQVTPDPGVIEVNIHPGAQLGRAGRAHRRTSTRRRARRGWRPRSSCSTAATPAPAAATTSCSAAPTPADSPFLRRPDLLRSLLALLAEPSRRCPTCSPACSSARPARRRASTRRATTRSTSSRSRFSQMPPPAQARPPPWLVDRLFRNLLVDVTGNTHRAEFCIDKLYLARRPHRPARPARAARLRDAAARAHEPRAAAAAARPDRAFWDAALRRAR